MISDVYSITMAAGAGNRMPSDMRLKASCKIGPVSVIENALDTYEQAGISRHVIVVGRGAEELMDEVTAKRPGVLFAYQGRPRGTGDAARRALDLLVGVGAPSSVLIAAGDKVIAPQVIRGLTEAFEASGSDLCLVGGRTDDHPGAGRIILRRGRVEAIIEVSDIRIRQLAAKLRALSPASWRTRRDLARLAAEYVRDPSKLAACFPALSGLLAGPADQPVSCDAVLAAANGIPEAFDLPGGAISPEEALNAPLCNLSVYVGRFAAIRSAVDRLRADNVQGEWYLTDVVQILVSGGGSVELFRAEDPEHVMAFNTLEQLEEVRKVYARWAQQPRRYPRIESWRNYFASRERDGLPATAGLLAEAVGKLGAEIGADKPCFLVRSPGTINLMGRHIDHQGGMSNLMAIDREIVLAASPREDDRINLWNASARDYPHRTFTFGELTADIVWEDWLRTLDTQFVQRYVSRNAGDWVNYAKGAALRLQHRFRDRKLRGMDALVCGNIPAAAGLNSSSALVVAVAEALVEINGLNVSVKEFIDLCGEGEWFVGTRGGSADPWPSLSASGGGHAAIKFGRENEVVAVSFFPFEVVAHHPFPADCRLVLSYSGASTSKTEYARARFNSRVACYHMAREVIKREFPRLSPLIQHLRDINTRRLDISLPALYGLLKRVPTGVAPKEVEALAREHPTVAKCVTGLNLAELDFPLRDVALYGLAECERAARAGDLLRRGDPGALGRMMSISHDGDRVAQWRPCRKRCRTDRGRRTNDHGGKKILKRPGSSVAGPWSFVSRHFENGATDETMDRLIEKSRDVQPLADLRAALWQQPGAYDCSTPEIDLMVDRALECPGVLGAQIAGAGLGGCIMILVRKEAVENVREVLRREYYIPQGVEPQVFACRASRGSQILTTVDTER